MPGAYEVGVRGTVGHVGVAEQADEVVLVHDDLPALHELIEQLRAGIGRVGKAGNVLDADPGQLREELERLAHVSPRLSRQPENEVDLDLDSLIVDLLHRREHPVDLDLLLDADELFLRSGFRGVVHAPAARAEQ